MNCLQASVHYLCAIALTFATACILALTFALALADAAPVAQHIFAHCFLPFWHDFLSFLAFGLFIQPCAVRQV